MPTGRCDKRPPVIAGPRYFVDIRSDDRTSMNSSVGRMNSGRSRLHGFDGTEAEPGSLIALASSEGLFEVAVVEGNAAERLDVVVGDPVTVGWAR